MYTIIFKTEVHSDFLSQGSLISTHIFKWWFLPVSCEILVLIATADFATWQHDAMIPHG